MNAQIEASPFCELDAVRLYCQVVNDLDVEPFLERLAADVHYSSHWVLTDLNTSDAVAKLLRGKIEHMRSTQTHKLEALVGVATCGWQYGKPITILRKPGSDSHEATVDFMIRDGLISAVAFVSPGVHQAALLENPDSYVYEGAKTAKPESNTETASAETRPAKELPPDLDPADLIATFADVDDEHYAPLTDEAIGRCLMRTMGGLEVRLVPFDYAPIQNIDHSGLAGALESARKREVYVFAMSFPAAQGLVGIMTLPRPQVPWFSGKLTSEEWYLDGEKKPYEVGISFDVACEMRIFTIWPLIRRQTHIVFRPRPRLALEELEERYLAIQLASSESLEINKIDVATWSRFLESAFGASRHIVPNGVVARLAMDSPQRRIAELALEAWPTKE